MTLRRILLIGTATLGLAPTQLGAQGLVDPQHGFSAVARSLRALDGVKRVLVIGAHPDDEDTELLAWLERGLGADAAYLSLTRGEGGQNLIGPELGVGLGLVRTGEILAARRLDGAEQFFTRAYDFGYSKSTDETFRFWPRDTVLADVVWAVRRFRPQVIVSIFSDSAGGGHGHHLAAGILARAAYEAAGDPARFPEHAAWGAPAHAPLKLYRSTRFDTAATTLIIETGTYDPLYGRSYHQIAMASRSQHRSQDMGRIEGLGPNRTRLARLESRVAAPSREAEGSLFEGVDTTLAGLAGAVASPGARRAVTGAILQYRAHLARAAAALGPDDLGRAVPPLGRALAALRRSIAAAATEPDTGLASFVLRGRERALEGALAGAASVIVGAFASDDLLVPGQGLDVRVEVWNGGASPVELRRVSVSAPHGWTVVPDAPEASPIPAESLTTREFRLVVSKDARPTEPYFLERPRSGALYTWPQDPSLRGLAFGPPLLVAEVELEIGGQTVRLIREVQYRYADQARGEIRRPVRVVPPVSVAVAPGTAVWPLGREEPLEFDVRLRGEAPGAVEGEVRLDVPAGWRVGPAAEAFGLPGPGSVVTTAFRLEARAGLVEGRHELTAVADAGGARYRRGFSVIDYPHIEWQPLYRDAAARVEVFPLEVPERLRVAVVPGAGDAVPDAIRAMGLEVDVLDQRAVVAGDLSVYDVIVIGIRAYETNPAVVAGNARLVDWVRGGGTLVVQYQQYAFFRGDFAPYPLRAVVPHDRVTDETAPIELLDPEHPVFNHPNRIGAADFAGWIQDRGLYFAHEWDDRYTPLLELADPGEPPKHGALLLARVGDGLYVYTGLALFRQWPAGVPGAYRLLANLLSLGG